MAEGIFEHLADLLNALTKALPATNENIKFIDGLHKGGWDGLDAHLKAGAAAAQIEVSDASSDIAETKNRTAIALAQARLQRHEQFKKVVVPTLLRMMKNSASNKVVCTAFALAGLHLIPNQDFDLSPVIDSTLIGVGTYFGYEVARDFRHKDAAQTPLSTTDLASLVEGMRKLDLKATMKLVSLVALNFYDSQPLTQAAVLSAVGVMAAVLPYGLILGIKYADMKGLDWQNWQGESRIGQLWQKTRIPELAGTTLIGCEKVALVTLPYAGRIAKTVAAGRLITKGLTMFAPIEPNLDAMVEHLSILQQFGIKGLVWGTTGAVVGYGAHSLTRMGQYGGKLLRHSGSKSSQQPPDPTKKAPTSPLHKAES